MKNRNVLRRGICQALNFGLIATGFAAPAVLAQEEDTAAALERVEVTGSRIRRAQIEGAQPILALSREDLLRSGVTSVGDILQQLSVSGSALNTKFNSSGNFGFPPDGGGVGAGATLVDLRHLDAKRTLVLVDGKRWVNESSASGVGGATDLNTIPISIVERVEVLNDGASTIYGSDAIAGVVNIITRKDFDGLEANAYYGQFDEGDGKTEAYDFSIGKTGGRSSVFFNVSYNQQERVSAADREQARFPVPGTGLTRGSSGTPQGRFIFNDPADPATVFDLTLSDGADGTDPADFRPFDGATDRFNFSPFNLVLTPSERASVYGQAYYDLTSEVTWYAKYLSNNRRSVNQAAPEPIFLGPGAGTGGRADTVSIDATNPFNPFGFDLDAGSNFILLGRRPLEGGPRVFEQNVNTDYFGSGFEGGFEWGGRLFDWDVNYIYSRNTADQTTNGTYNIRNIELALGPVAECNADPQCVPLNLFGGQGPDDTGSITQDMLDYILVTAHDKSEQVLRSYTANLSGEVVDLPAGPLGVAVGYEHRNQSGFYQPDAVTVAGDSNGVPSLPTRGRYSVSELYGEVVAPLLADMPAVELLEVEASVRSSDYSTFGSTSTGKFGFRWKPTGDVLIRGTFAEGFRAPSIGELFGSESRFDAVLADLCSDFNNSGVSQQIIDNCIALGVPDDGSYQQVNPQISITTGGNPNLEPETSDSTTFGVVYSASWAENTSWSEQLDFEFTYYNHEIKDAIGPQDAQTQLDRCVSLFHLDPTLCNGIARNLSGAIAGFDNLLENLGSIETDGYDFNITYSSPETSLGRFNVTWLNSFVNEFTETDATGNIRSLEGVEVNDTAIPEWQSNMRINWTLSDWEVAYTIRLIDGVTESCSDFLDGTPSSLTQLGLCSDPNFADESLSTNRLGTTVYNDVQATYYTGLLGTDAGITFGINNLLDRDPPVCLSCSLNGYDASTHDIPGRFGYVRLNVTF